MDNKTITDDDFLQLQQEFEQIELIEKSIYSWVNQKDKWFLKKKALTELKTLYEKLGLNQFMELASSAILVDPGSCSPVPLLELVDDQSLYDQYQIERQELNRKFLSKIFLGNQVNQVKPTHIMKYLAEAIGFSEISKEFVDNIKLNPNSSLFSKEYVEQYGASLTDNKDGWATCHITNEDMIKEAITIGNTFWSEYNSYDARKVYENALELITDNSINQIPDLILRIILCQLVTKSAFNVKYSVDSYSEKYPTFKDSKQYAYLQIVNKALAEYECSIHPDYDEFVEATKRYREDTTVDPFIRSMLEHCSGIFNL
ncbi:MAG: hypothetical protein Barrevirus27_6 [Barrevirus sp.]|uniref:Uncharacterized protein n=1 Tax=Barrevirus sp. TaxID=2487763 RepID=A0A3G4ZV33_9VIRU|nr:MAG: hypothetical protein Barrevirus27_6 [Barrevirus sp.]